MEKPKDYNESIQSAAYNEYLKCEEELSLAVKELHRLTETVDIDEIPYEAVDKINEMHEALGIRLQDWFESLGL